MRRAPRPTPPPAPPPAARRPKAGASPRVRLGTDERRAQLLMLGIEAFAARSYDEVSIDEIARAAGVSKGLLYHYFPTKRDFYRAAIEVVARRLLEETDLPDSVPPVERLQIGLERYLAFAERHGREFAALLRGGIGSDLDVGRIIEATRAEFVERTLERLPGAEPTPLLRTAVRGWVGFVEATSLEWAERRDVAPEALLQLWVGVLWDLLRRLDAASGPGALAGDVLQPGRSPGRRGREPPGTGTARAGAAFCGGAREVLRRLRPGRAAQKANAEPGPELAPRSLVTSNEAPSLAVGRFRPHDQARSLVGTSFVRFKANSGLRSRSPTTSAQARSFVRGHQRPRHKLEATAEVTNDLGASLKLRRRSPVASVQA